MITWKELLSNKDVKKHSTSKQEVANLLAVVERDLKDAALKGLSADRRFATAYNAALQLCKISIGCAGYLVSASAHHQKSFEYAEIAVGKKVNKLIAYFEYCRRKRNTLDYDKAGVVTKEEADELLEKTIEFKDIVIKWLKAQHKSLL